MVTGYLGITRLLLATAVLVAACDLQSSTTPTPGSPTPASSAQPTTSSTAPRSTPEPSRQWPLGDAVEFAPEVIPGAISPADRSVDSLIYLFDSQTDELLSVAGGATWIGAVSPFGARALAMSESGDELFLIDAESRTLTRLGRLTSGELSAQIAWTGPETFRLAIRSGNDWMPAGLFDVNINTRTVAALEIGDGSLLIPITELTDGTQLGIQRSSDGFTVTLHTPTGATTVIEGSRSTPRISADGSTLAGFTGDDVITIASAAGATEIHLGAAISGNPSIAWSFDSRLAIVDLPGESVFILDTASGHVYQIDQLENPTASFWSSSGKYLAIRTGSSVTIIATDSESVAHTLVDAFLFGWAPDRDEVLLSVGSCESEQPLSLVLFDVFTGTTRPLAPQEAGFQLAPAWDPDGKQIAATNKNGVFFIDISSGSITHRLGEPEGLVVPGQPRIQWSETGRWLFAWQSISGRSLCP